MILSAVVAYLAEYFLYNAGSRIAYKLNILKDSCNSSRKNMYKLNEKIFVLKENVHYSYTSSLKTFTLNAL